MYLVYNNKGRLVRLKGCFYDEVKWWSNYSWSLIFGVVATAYWLSMVLNLAEETLHYVDVIQIYDSSNLSSHHFFCLVSAPSKCWQEVVPGNISAAVKEPLQTISPQPGCWDPQVEVPDAGRLIHSSIKWVKKRHICLQFCVVQG